MPPKKVKQPNNSTTNFYEKLPPHLKVKPDNPDFEKHGLTLPFRGLIVGASGSGKTTLLLEILSRMPRTFSKVVICCRSSAEPLYQYMVESCDADTLDFFEYDKDGLPPIDDYKSGGNKLIVYDDLISLSKKELQPVVDAFIRGRKYHCSLLFLTQSYYQCPKTIRLQCDLVFLKKIGSTRDLGAILRETSLGVNQDQLLNIYKRCTKNRGDFLLIKLYSSEEEGGKFCHNFHSPLSVTG
jgi:hypothetical protein